MNYYALLFAIPGVIIFVGFFMTTKKDFPVSQWDLEGKHINDFDSIGKASLLTGESKKNIRTSCEGESIENCLYVWKKK